MSVVILNLYCYKDKKEDCLKWVEKYVNMTIDERWEEELKFRNKHFAKILRDELLLNVESGCICSSYYGKNGKL